MSSLYGRELAARELSGRELAAEIRAATASRAAELAAAGRPPRLAVVTATADEASVWYVRSLTRTAAKAGIICDITDLVPHAPGRPESQQATVAGIRAALTTLSGDPAVHGILLQTPLPGGARLAELASFIDPAEDVDGANPVSLGRLMTGLPAFAPATAAAVLALLDHYQVALSGRRAVVVGRSAVVGKPVAQLLIGRDATVTVCHTRTVDLASVTRTAAKAGIACDVIDLVPNAPDRPESQDATVAGIRAALTALSGDPAVHGIVLQTPLPGGARLADLAGAIDPAKDVDGANPVSLGRLMTGLPAFAPATAAAVLALLDHHQVALSGRRAVVVGRSAVVGKPVAQLLIGRDATVTVCHSRTVDLASVTRVAVVLVVAAGRPGLIGPEHVAVGATVIDVGINATAGGGMAGDVDPAVAGVAGGLSPVPGGVGPVTTAVLLRHVTEAAAASVA